MNIIKIGIFLVIFWMFGPSFGATLESRTPGCSSSHAVVLVGGFKNDWSYFAPWEEAASQTGCVYGFVADYQQMTMTEAAELLSTELNEQVLSQHQSVTILAHSMGGLVTKKALYSVDFKGHDVKFHAYGTPWGGYGFANVVRYLPGAQAIASLIGFPMSAEMGNGSPFMASLRTPLPENVQMSIYASVDDTVAAPTGTASIHQFDAIAAQANFTQYAGIGHDDFVLSLRNPL